MAPSLIGNVTIYISKFLTFMADATSQSGAAQEPPEGGRWSGSRPKSIRRLLYSDEMKRIKLGEHEAPSGAVAEGPVAPEAERDDPRVGEGHTFPDDIFAVIMTHFPRSTAILHQIRYGTLKYPRLCAES